VSCGPSKISLVLAPEDRSASICFFFGAGLAAGFGAGFGAAFAAGFGAAFGAGRFFAALAAGLAALRLADDFALGLLAFFFALFGWLFAAFFILPFGAGRFFFFAMSLLLVGCEIAENLPE